MDARLLLILRQKSDFFFLFFVFSLFDFIATCVHVGHPFGSLLSGFISDAIGRRKALMFIVSPAILAFIALGFADSFITICALFFFLSFLFGLKDAPATIYVSEVSEPSVCLIGLLHLKVDSVDSILFFIYTFYVFFFSGAWYVIGHWDNCTKCRIFYYLFAGDIFSMASSIPVHYNFARHHCDCDMLCK